MNGKQTQRLWLSVVPVPVALVLALAGSVAAWAEDVVVAQQTAQAPVTVPSPQVNPGPAPAPELTQPGTPETPAMPGSVNEPIVGDPSKTIAPTLPGPAPSLPNPVHFAFIWQHSLGEGTFAVNPYVRNPLYAWWISFRARYDLPYGFGVSLRQDLDYEVTRSEGATYLNQPLLGDTRIGVRNNYLKWDAAGIHTSIYVGYRAPLSLESRFRRQLGAMDVGLSLDWSKWGISLSAFTLGVVNARAWGKPQTGSTWIDQWFMQDNDSRALRDRSGRTIPTQKCIARASEAASGGCPTIGATNGNIASAMGWLSVGYDFSALLNIPISVSAGVVLMQALSAYVGPNDQFTAANARYGFTGNTFTWGLMSLSYQFTDWMGVDVGIQSLQPLFSYDRNITTAGRTLPWVRFPFWNIPYWNLGNLGQYAGGNNYSAFYTSITIAK